MKLGPEAIKQMYPQFANAECEQHGEQRRANVPQHLRGVFANRPDSSWVCSACVDEAKKQYTETQRALRQQKHQEKENRRAAIKQAREDAKNADKALAEYVASCQNAVEAVKAAEGKLETTRSKVRAAKSKTAGAEQRLVKAKEDYHAHASAVLQLEELSAQQFEELDCADADVATCYNVLQGKLDETDALWECLGKAAKKKRDKSSKKAALGLLREHQQAAEEVQSTGEQEQAE